MQPIGRALSPNLPALVALALAGGCSEPEFVPVPTTIEISPSAPVLGDFGDTVQLTATVKNQNGEAMPWVPVSWTGVGMFVVHVSENGLVTATEPGRARVRASAETAMAGVDVVVEPGPRAVLHRFYRRLGGDDWVKNTGWKTARPLNQWFGVFTNAEGGIQVLWLPENGLKGEIPLEVGSLESLFALGLAENLLTGKIPPELGNLRNLRNLTLRSNQLTGEIPPELGNLQNLNSLNLGLNELTGSIPPELGKLENLRSLYLDSNQLAGAVPGELGDISPLLVLVISHNPLSGILPGDLTQLNLGVFHWNYTDLCAPVDIAFQNWLLSIPSHRGNPDC